MKRIAATIVISLFLLTFSYGQEAEVPAPDDIDVDGGLYAAPFKIGSVISSARCLAQGGRIVDESIQCNYDEITYGKVTDAGRLTRCCKEPSSAELGGVLDKLQKYYKTDPVSASR